MTTVIITPLPPTPTDASTPAEWDVWLRAVDSHNRAMHAQAQADTAVAMHEAAAAQRYTADKFAEPAPVRKPTRAELVWDMVKVQPQASILTPGAIVNGARDIVDAYIKAFPAAVEG